MIQNLPVKPVNAYGEIFCERDVSFTEPIDKVSSNELEYNYLLTH